MSKGEIGIQNLIQAGLRAHHAGRLEEAKALYEQALAIRPRHPDALHLAGVVALQAGEPERAVALIQQAVEVQPDNPGFHANLAQAYLASRRYGDARAAFRRAATLEPRDPQFAVGAANCLAMQGSVAEAEQELHGVTQRHYGYALAWFNLGNVVQEQGRQQEAEEYYRRAIELDPAFADAHTNLGGVLRALGRFDEAEQACRRCLELQPDSATAYCNLAAVLIDRGRFAEAESLCRQALLRSPRSEELYLLLGSACTRQGRLTSALEAFRSATDAAPHNPRALWAYGYALLRTGRETEGLQWLEQGLKLQPDLPEFQGALSGIYLSLGDLRAGWAEYQRRPARLGFLADNPNLRLASDLPDRLSGRSICLLREQGLGDELFFLRFAAAVKSRGADITYCAHHKIASMLARVPVLDRVIDQTDPLPAADAVLLAGDLPHALGALDFPPPLALAPLPEQLESMKQRLAALGPPPYLGLTWRAGTAPEQQRGVSWMLHKTIPLDRLDAVLRGVDGTLVALQRNPEVGEIERLAGLARKPVHDLTSLNEDLEALLALLALLDDYVGVSNTNMHLRAGAGRTAKVLVPQPPEWRWMASGDESPWFPGFRVYRQQANGDWSAAFDHLARDLHAQYGAPKQ